LELGRSGNFLFIVGDGLVILVIVFAVLRIEIFVWVRGGSTFLVDPELVRIDFFRHDII
jgi:hypothetical protein